MNHGRAEKLGKKKSNWQIDFGLLGNTVGAFFTCPWFWNDDSRAISRKLLLCSTLYQIRVSLTTTSLSFLLYYLFLFFYLYQKQPRRNIPIISTCFFSFQISEWLNIMGSISAMHFLIVHGICSQRFCMLA